MASDESDLAALEALGQEFLDRQRQGEQVAVSDYADSHPHLADEIREFFPTMIAMERFKSCSATSSSGNVSLQLEPFTQLGDYRILAEIGRGGMGVVYEAEQQSLQRRVAVKVFPRKTLRDSRQLNRFHREARTAARLHHTNIVPVFGVGEQDGLHYFVMQRIDGTSLESLSRGRDLSGSGHVESQVAEHRADGESTRGGHSADVTPRRDRAYWNHIAGIGMQVAEALRYAHAQGVLHCDIKPSNLVLDPKGTVWVTDFGLATILEAEQQGESNEIAGTLRFMAPEHIGGEQDARSDQYSLGLTLYELLTERPAFENGSRSTLASKILAGDLTPPREVRPDIPRDLEAIVLKSIALEPDERYADAGALATDLRRFLQSRTVSARRVGPLVKLRHWSRRNPTAAALTAALLLMAVVSFGVISAKWRDAVAESGRAENNLALALESMDQILERFGSGWMAQPIATGPDASSTDIESMDETGIEFPIAVSDYSVGVLQDALGFYDKFAQQNPTNPQLNHDTAKVHRRVADIYQRLGQHDKAERAYRRSLSFLHSDSAASGETVTLEMASTRNQLGQTLLLSSRFQAAEKELRHAQQILTLAAHRDTPEYQAEHARVLTNLGQNLWLMFRHAEAARSQQRAVTVLEELVSKNETNSAYRLALGRAYRSHYTLLLFTQGGKHESVRRAGIEILEDLVHDYPNVPDFQCELSETLATAGFTSHLKGDRERRISDLERSIQLSRDLSAAHYSIPRYRVALARGIKELAEEYERTDPNQADKLYAESVALYRSLSLDFTGMPAARLFYAKALQDHARNLRRLGRVGDARLLLDDAVVSQEAYVELRPDNRFGKMMLAHLYKNLADALSALDLNAEAELAMQKARRLLPEHRKRSARSKE